MDPDLPNLIVLFTDGIIDLPGKTTNKDVEKMLEMGDKARNKNIKIATISLNYSGNSNTSSLKILSDKTVENPEKESLFHEVTNAKNLKNAFEKIHTSLFLFEKKTLKEGKNTFYVPPIGAEVFTFTFSPTSPSDDFKLTSPKGNVVYTKTNARQIDNGLCVIMIEKPESGIWFAELSTGGVIVRPEEKLSFFKQAWNALYLWIMALLAMFISTIVGIPAKVAVNFITNRIEEGWKIINEKIKSGIGKIAFGACFTLILLIVLPILCPGIYHLIQATIG